MDALYSLSGRYGLPGKERANEKIKGGYFCFNTKIVDSRLLKNVYRLVSKKRGTNFLAASDMVEPSPIDNEHMDVESNRIFADAISKNS